MNKQLKRGTRVVDKKATGGLPVVMTIQMAYATLERDQLGRRVPAWNYTCSLPTGGYRVLHSSETKVYDGLMLTKASINRQPKMFSSSQYRPPPTMSQMAGKNNSPFPNKSDIPYMWGDEEDDKICLDSSLDLQDCVVKKQEENDKENIDPPSRAAEDQVEHQESNHQATVSTSRSDDPITSSAALLLAMLPSTTQSSTTQSSSRIFFPLPKMPYPALRDYGDDEQTNYEFERQVCCLILGSSLVSS